MDTSRLKLFPRAFFQDVLTVMLALDADSLSREFVESVILVKVDERNEEIARMGRIQKPNIRESFAKMPVSKKYEIFKERNPDSKMTIEEFIEEIRAGKVPCKNCPDKEE